MSCPVEQFFPFEGLENRCFLQNNWWTKTNQIDPTRCWRRTWWNLFATSCPSVFCKKHQTWITTSKTDVFLNFHQFKNRKVWQSFFLSQRAAEDTHKISQKNDTSSNLVGVVSSHWALGRSKTNIVNKLNKLGVVEQADWNILFWKRLSYQQVGKKQ